MTGDVPMQGIPSRPAPTNPNPLTDPGNAPLGTIVVFPRWQDGHHPTDIAIRWSPPDDVDEQRPWIILGSDGPQRLDNDAVEGCRVLDIRADVACWYAAKPRRWFLAPGDMTEAELAAVVEASKQMPMIIRTPTDASCG